MVSNLKEFIKNLIEEIEKEELEVDEATTTSNVDGYNTPHAFTSKEDEKKKNKSMADIVGYDLVEVDLKNIKPGDTIVIKNSDRIIKEATNRYHQLRKDEGTPNQKIGKGIREMRKQIQEIEKFVEWYSKLKKESGLSSEQYWKRTHRNLFKIKERLNNIAVTITKL